MANTYGLILTTAVLALAIYYYWPQHTVTMSLLRAPSGRTSLANESSTKAQRGYYTYYPMVMLTIYAVRAHKLSYKAQLLLSSGTYTRSTTLTMSYVAMLTMAMLTMPWVPSYLLYHNCTYGYSL